VTARAQKLIERATTATGLTDFGAAGWQIGLTHLLDALDVDLADEPAAVTTVESMIVGRLMSRLRVEAWYADQDDGRPPPIEGPLVIVGLPRTATTALHYLLAVDSQFRYPRQWEMAVPVPPPDADTEGDDPRLAAAGSRGDDVRHISSVDGPTEDGLIHALHFGHQELSLPVPSYRSWWRSADLIGTFAYQERVLRLLHSRRPPQRWLLKAPAYLFHLPEMARHYPAARFVMTHRDPVVALPSTCSVVVEARQKVLPEKPEDNGRLGQEMVTHFARGVERAMRAREVIGEHRFLDVGQEEVERDPVNTAASIYDFAGLTLQNDVKAAMHEWAAANTRGSRGVHQYTAEEFGLTVDGIRKAFATYCEGFRIHFSPGSR
jgi:Sulfotransferase family